jgi:FkbM family methyltransferase
MGFRARFFFHSYEEHDRTEHFTSDLIVDGSAVRKTTRPVRIPVKPVSEILKEAAPTVLIVDIEGGELEFLRQARRRRWRNLTI